MQRHGGFKNVSQAIVDEGLDTGWGRHTHWMEEVMTEAEQRGDFATLPGKGKPLNLRDSDPYAGPEADLYGMLKEAGFTPEWVELRKQIAGAITWLREHPSDAERSSRITEANWMIDRHNKLIPTPSLAFPKLPRN